MKRRIIFCLLSTLMVAVLVLTSCTSTPATTTPTTSPTTKPTTTPTTKPTTSPTTTKPTGATSTNAAWDAIIAKETLQKTVIGIGTEGGAAYVRIAGFSQILNKYTPIRGVLTTKSWVTYSANDFETGASDYFDLSPAQYMVEYRSGVSTPNNQRIRIRLINNAGGVGMSFTGFYQIGSKAVNSFAELKGKRIVVHASGSTWKAVAKACLEANGFVEGKDIEVVYSNDINAAADMLIEGKVDAMTSVMGTATVRIQSEGKGGLWIIPLNEKEQALGQKYAGTTPGLILKGILGCQIDTQAFADPLGMTFRVGINNLTMYTITKTFWDHIDEYYLVQEKCLGYTKENNLKLFVIPWHPGAIRYYQEIGWWTEEHTKLNYAAIEREREIYGGEVPDIAAYRALGVAP